MPGKYSSPRRIGIVAALKKEGLSNNAISQRIGKDRRTVDRIVKRLENDPEACPKAKSGRPRCSTARDDRRLKNAILEDRRRGSTELQAIMEDSGVSMSKRTVRHRLQSMGYIARKPRKKPLLTNNMKKARLNWAREHKDWSIERWKRVLWSDESRFNLYASDGRRLVRRRPGEEFHPSCLERKVKHPDGVMIWGCFSWFGVGRLFICEKMVNQDEYLTILRTRLLPSMADLEENFGVDRDSIVFQDDSAPAHRARRVSFVLYNT